jgi:hypothetical protein
MGIYLVFVRKTHNTQNLIRILYNPVNSDHNWLSGNSKITLASRRRSSGYMSPLHRNCEVVQPRKGIDREELALSPNYAALVRGYENYENTAFQAGYVADSYFRTDTI